VGSKNHWVVNYLAIAEVENVLVFVEIRELNILGCGVYSPDAYITTNQLDIQLMLYLTNLVHF
jgi:hypothetical protein